MSSNARPRRPKNTLHANKIANVGNEYTDEITKIRISHDHAYEDEGKHWALDGIDERDFSLTEDVEYYTSHKEAVADIPMWMVRNRYRFVDYATPKVD